MRPSSNREFENHFRVFPSAVRVDAIRIVFGDSAESFIPCRVLRTARAGRSAEDRLLCKQEALGSNPSRSTSISDANALVCKRWKSAGAQRALLHGRGFKPSAAWPSRSAGLQTAALHERIQETVKYRRGQLRLRWTRIRQADGP